MPKVCSFGLACDKFVEQPVTTLSLHLSHDNIFEEGPNYARMEWDGNACALCLQVLRRLITKIGYHPIY